MDKLLLETFAFSIIVIFAIITLRTFIVEPMGDEKLLNIGMITLLTLFIVLIIMIGIGIVVRWTN